MEIRTYALSILSSGSLEDKLVPPPPDLTDRVPGPPERWERPRRNPPIAFAPRGQRRPMPGIGALGDPQARATTLHTFANHELMAAELMAFALLAFPTMPESFRRGLIQTLADEQRHFRLYEARLHALGIAFGAEPVNDHFWISAPGIQTPLEYVATMALTFESGNLDFALTYAAAFKQHGDLDSARVLETIYRDEIQHVRFGVGWLRRLKPPEQSDWDAYTGALNYPNTPARARGAHFDRASREEAGMDEAFIAQLEGLQTKKKRRRHSQKLEPHTRP